jgi:hypothetical protein
MKDILKEFLIEPFTQSTDWFSRFIGIFMWAIMLTILSLIIWGGILLIDSTNLPIKEKDGIVIDKYVRPAFITTTMIPCGKSFIPITNYIPESFYIVISIDKLNDDVVVDENIFTHTNIGSKIHCKYANGRIKNSLYIKEIN